MKILFLVILYSTGAYFPIGAQLTGFCIQLEGELYERHGATFVDGVRIRYTELKCVKAEKKL